MSDKDKDQLLETLVFNEDKTQITFTVEASTPISEAEFIYCLSDFVKCYGDGFNYNEVGHLIPFELFGDIDPSGVDFH